MFAENVDSPAVFRSDVMQKKELHQCRHELGTKDSWDFDARFVRGDWDARFVRGDWDARFVLWALVRPLLLFKSRGGVGR